MIPNTKQSFPKQIPDHRPTQSLSERLQNQDQLNAPIKQPIRRKSADESGTQQEMKMSEDEDSESSVSSSSSHSDTEPRPKKALRKPIALYTTATLSKFGASAFNKIASQSDIIVIGAGISGLKAALDLAKSDDSLRVTVIEARDRLGGRTFAIPVPGVADAAANDDSVEGVKSTSQNTPKYVDLGAAFLEGWAGNPMWELSTEVLDLKPQPVLHDLANQVHFDYDGKPLSKESVDKVLKIFNELEDIMFDDSFCVGTDMSIGEAVQQLMQEKNITFDNEQEERFFIHCIQNYENHNGGSVNHLSLKRFYDGPEFLPSNQAFYEPDECDLFVAGGYAKITEHIARQLEEMPNARIILNAQVTKVIYEGLHGETVRVFVKHTDSNSRRSKTTVLNANQCICTLPIGVLKQNRVQFVPPLPRKKQESLDHLGVGLLDKVVIAFPRAFWKDNMHALNYVSTEAGKYRLFLNVSAYEANKGSAILVCYVAADAAAKMENMADEEIKTEVLEVLHNCFPQENIPEPIFFRVTRWNNDPYSLGSFSFMGKESSMEDFECLAEPVGGNLFFAGEHTSGHYASMHGAYLSGERAACEVMSMRKQRAENSKRSARAQSL